MNRMYQGVVVAVLAVLMTGCNTPESTDAKWQQTEATIKSVAELGEYMYAYTLVYPVTASTAVNAAGEPIVGPIAHNVFGLTYLPKTGQTLKIEYLREEPLMYRIVQPWGASDKPVAGVYTYGHEVESFAPCNTEAAYWITGHETVLNTLKDASLAKAEQLQAPYQGIYAEVNLALLPAAEDGFAADYDGVVQALEVKKWRKDIPKTCLRAMPEARSEPAPTAYDEHSSRNSLDWEGIYYGAIPCASCPQIDRWLELKQQGESTSVELVDIYRGSDELVSELSATARWTEDGGAIVIADNTAAPLRFIVGESALLQYNKGEAPLEQYQLGKMLHYGDDAMDLYTDRSHLLNMQGSGEFKAIVHYKAPAENGARSAQMRVEVDCKQRTYTIAETTAYAGRFASGALLTTNTPKTSHPLTDKTALAAAASEVCL